MGIIIENQSSNTFGLFFVSNSDSVYDSFGKMGSNVEGGNTNQPGLLQQCRSAHGPTFSGQYCQVFLRQVTTNMTMNIKSN